MGSCRSVLHAILGRVRRDIFKGIRLTKIFKKSCKVESRSWFLSQNYLCVLLNCQPVEQCHKAMDPRFSAGQVQLNNEKVPALHST